jgi:hypothetical protein
MITLFLILASLLAPAARAEIPEELFPQGNCRPQVVQAGGEDGGVRILSGVRCHSLYSDAQLIEIEVAGLGGDKEFYFYDRNETYEFERARKGFYVQRAGDLGYQEAAVLSLGKGPAGGDRYVVNLLSVGRSSPPAPVEIYVKAGGRQVEGRALFLD